MNCQSYEYGDAGSHVLTPLFRLGHLLDENEYQQRIVPCLCKLFSSPDRVTRVKLLERIDEFAPHLTPQIVNERIYMLDFFSFVKYFSNFARFEDSYFY